VEKEEWQIRSDWERYPAADSWLRDRCAMKSESGKDWTHTRDFNMGSEYLVCYYDDFAEYLPGCAPFILFFIFTIWCRYGIWVSLWCVVNSFDCSINNVWLCDEMCILQQNNTCCIQF
jgi:hypothetical protein